MNKQEFYELVIRERMGPSRLEEVSHQVTGSSYNWDRAINLLCGWEGEMSKITQPPDDSFDSYSRLLYEVEHLKGIHRNILKTDRSVLGEIEKILDALSTVSINKNFYELIKESSVSFKSGKSNDQRIKLIDQESSHSFKSNKGKKLFDRIMNILPVIPLIPLAILLSMSFYERNKRTEDLQQDQRIEGLIDDTFAELNQAKAHYYRDSPHGANFSTADDCDGLSKRRALDERKKSAEKLGIRNADAAKDVNKCSYLIVHRASAKLNIGELKGAKKDIYRALHLKNDNCRAIGLYGVVLARESQDQKAIKQFFRAIECHKAETVPSNFAELYYQIAGVYGRSGDCKKRKEYLRIAALRGSMNAQLEYNVLKCE
ncbi:hypothetical protein [Synechococcus sp. UW69]|uniref:hypothetical protein n=1 Tax=Synechococcus sp. UW69 TaxID=368493 RepID=UPI0010BD26DB|nr:hypothetical protein [Synechococcus sp. UW69]